MKVVSDSLRKFDLHTCRRLQTLRLRCNILSDWNCVALQLKLLRIKSDELRILDLSCFPLLHTVDILCIKMSTLLTTTNISDNDLAGILSGEGNENLRYLAMTSAVDIEKEDRGDVKQIELQRGSSPDAITLRDKSRLEVLKYIGNNNTNINANNSNNYNNNVYGMNVMNKLTTDKRDNNLFAYGGTISKTRSLEVDNCPSVRMIVFTNHPLLQRIVVHHAMTALLALDLSSNFSITDATLTDMLTKCTNIVSLKLSQCLGITDALLPVISKNLRRLMLLDLEECLLQQPEIRCKHLRYLNLSKCHRLQDLPRMKCKKLESLSINQLPSLSSALFVAISRKSKELKNLWICDCCIVRTKHHRHHAFYKKRKQKTNEKEKENENENENEKGRKDKGKEKEIEGEEKEETAVFELPNLQILEFSNSILSNHFLAQLLRGSHSLHSVNGVKARYIFYYFCLLFYFCKC